jgi:type 1 glutamine amidotransferase
MPTGLPQQLGPDKMRDLLTFLLTPPPHMPEDNPMPTPPARTRAEVEAVLAGAPEAIKPDHDLNILLVTGPKDHGPGEHDYPAWGAVWRELLQAPERTNVQWTQAWPSSEQFNHANVIVFYEHGDWNETKARDVDAFLERGGGLVYIHFAVDGGQQSRSLADRIGLSWIGGSSTFRHGPLDLEFNRGSKHPIARNFERLNLVDESYWQLTGDLPADDVLASGIEDEKPQPLFWAKESGKGRVFVSIPGHYSWTFDDPLYRTLLLRGISWAAKEPVDRLNEAVYPGAHITD